MTAENKSRQARIPFISLILILVVLAAAIQANDTDRAARSIDELPALEGVESDYYSRGEIAPAKILYEGAYKHDTWNETRFTVVRRIRINTEEGRAFGEFSIVLKQYESIESVKGRIIRADGSRQNLPELPPVSQQITYENPWGPELHQCYRLEGVEAGEIIEYQYSIVTQLGLGLRFNVWYLQDIIPTEKSVFTLDTPLDFMPLKAEVENIDLDLWPDIEETEERKISSYSFVNIPALEVEPLMPPTDYVLGRFVIDYQWSRSYSSQPVGFWLQAGRNQAMRVNRFLEEYRGIPETVKSLVTKKMDTRDRAAAILMYVRENITNLAHLPADRFDTSEIEYWEPFESVGKVLEYKEGGPQEIAMLTVALLREAGVSAYLALAVNRKHGVLRHTFLDTRQFTHVFVAIRMPDNTALYIDPTVASLEPGRIPWYIQGSLALICRRQSSFFVRLPVDKPKENLVRFQVLLNRQSEDKADGEIKFEFHGQHAMELIELAQIEGNKEAEQKATMYLTDRLWGMELTKIDFAGDWTNPLNESIHGRAQISLSTHPEIQSAQIDFRKLALYQKTETINASRTQPVYFNFPWSIEIDCQIRGLEGSVLELPENLAVKSEVGEILANWEIEKNYLKWQKRILQDRIFFNPKEVVLYQQFVEMVRSLENDQLARILSR